MDGPLDRGAAMAERVAATARRQGLDAHAADALARRLLRIIEARAIEDPDDPRFLHPARNALILLDDLGSTDTTELSAAMGCDGEAAWPEGADAAARRLLDAVPRLVERDRLLEDLLCASIPVRRIALADRLDLARHLHLRPADTWEPFHDETRTVWLPVAERTHEVLARRLRWWTAMFERRWLPRVRA